MLALIGVRGQFPRECAESGLAANGSDSTPVDRDRALHKRRTGLETGFP
jgi:hypothetical protein